MGAHAAGVDVGGTFTDVVALDRDRPRAVKVPTTPDDQGEGVVHGLRVATGDPPPPFVGHGTTTATNAILERHVARTVLVTTHGFADLLEIGRQHRPSLYDLSVTKPAPLVTRDDVVTAHERMAPDGRPVIGLEPGEAARVAAAVTARAPAAVAVCLLFAYANPVHEQQLAMALAEALGDRVPITLSSDLLPEFREYERASTCALNAAVAPVMTHYLRGLARRLPGTRIAVMSSGGGTISLEAAAAAPVHTLLSGPAAGVVAAGAAAVAAGYPDAVALDMGGTSTDVCLITDGRPDIGSEGEIGGLPFRTPSVGIHTVGAGGGSIASIDPGGALRVGPRSAGARPGPACYGHGGTLPTVTDAHAVLGHLDPARELGAPGEGAIHLDVEAAQRALGQLGIESAAQGVLTVVRATMARALRRVTTERGIDPGGLALVAYGGAGPLHATALGRELGVSAVVIPPAPGVLSALGLLLAPPRVETSRTVVGAAEQSLERIWEELDVAAAAELKAQTGSPPARLARIADCRYRGQSHELRLSDPADVVAAFTTAHEQAYGYAMPGEPVEVVTLRVVAEGSPALEAPPAEWDQGPARPERRRHVGVGGDMLAARVLDRAALAAGDEISGPALIEQPDSTTLLAPGETATCDAAGNLVVRWS